jgi:hypothetical protein
MYMGTFAETAIIDYHLSFADQENKLYFMFQFAANKGKFAISVFCLQQTNGSCCFLLVSFSGYKYICKYIYIRKRIYIDINMYLHIYMLPFQIENGNGSPGNFPYSVYHLLIEQMEVCHLSLH